VAERKKLLLRLDENVYEAIARWAAHDLRSVNAQIEYALRRALAAAGRDVRPPPGRNSADDPEGAGHQARRPEPDEESSEEPE
jgi:hypothetical protein